MPKGEFVELTELRRAMESASRRTLKHASKLRGTAYTEPTTGLPNLAYLREVLPSKLDAMSVDQPGAFVLLDLDGYVTANESLGLGGDKKILSAAIERMDDVIDDFATCGDRPLLILSLIHI